MTTTTLSALSALEHDEVEHARDLVEGALKRNGLTRAELRAVLQPGFQRAAYQRGEHPSQWACETAHDRKVVAAGRLLLRLRRELGLPLEAPQGPSALSVAEELLQ
jgi:hypothetical protein